MSKYIFILHDGTKTENTIDVDKYYGLRKGVKAVLTGVYIEVAGQSMNAQTIKGKINEYKG